MCTCEGTIGIKTCDLTSGFRHEENCACLVYYAAGSSNFLLITNLTHFFNVFIISLLCVFRATRCSSSGGPIISIRHPVCITLCSWLSGMLVLTGIPDSHLHRVIHTRWCIDTIGPPDDEHRVARNTQRSEIINTLKKCVKLVINKNCNEMHSQQNIKFSS